MIKRYKPMVPTLVEQTPKGLDWVYEVKYDGFRCLLYIEQSGISLISRNLNNLSDSFPDVIAIIEKYIPVFSKYLPIVLDGELVILDSIYRANFEKIQLRGRTKNSTKIKQLAEQFPASYCGFDLLVLNGKEIVSESYLLRKQKLAQLFNELDDLYKLTNTRLYYVTSTNDIDNLWRNISEENGEGVIAKRQNSNWQEGVRTTNWLKIKNWKVATFIILSVDKKNGYFNVGLIKGDAVQFVGLFSHGLSSDERQALFEIVRNNAIKEDKQYIYINPSICVDLQFLDWYNGELRQPRFSKFRLDKKWEECTWEEALKQSMR
ncbi:non-homologous end-joining DNA ligase [Bacillus sp. Marseille-P3661]|uniref:non-homologous end-joining DNA ligase n=1 Tax=Bacillus sp. Marseille-P3661 TaxID=1936234 RepID=UPI000C83CC52|nr:non-homologous end-joining DNA ligase [Bacillus sp. Marseille-P3661]